MLEESKEEIKVTNLEENNGDQELGGAGPSTSMCTKPLLPTDPYSKNWSYREVFFEFNKRAIPFALVRMVDTAGEVAAGYLLAREGATIYLAANNLIIVSNRLIIAPAAASFFSIPSRYGECKDNAEEVGSLIRKAFACAGLLSVIVIPVLLSSGEIFKRIGIDPAVCDVVEDYYIGAVFNIPITILSAVVQQFGLVIGRQKEVLLINILNNVLSVGLGSLFMFGPNKLGARGLGYGYSLSAFVISGCYIAYFNCVNDFKKYKFTRKEIADLKNFWKLLLEASPFSVQMAADFLLMYLSAIMAGWLSTEALSASRIADMIYILPYLVITRYPQVTCIMGGSARAAKNPVLVDQVFNVNIATMLGLVAIWSIVAWSVSPQLVNLFDHGNNSEHHQIKVLAKDLFWLYPISLLPEIARYTAAGALRGFKDYRISMINSLIWLALLGSAALYLGYQFGDSLNWIYASKIVALSLGGASLVYQYQKKKTDYFKQNPPNAIEGSSNANSSSLVDQGPHRFFNNKLDDPDQPSSSTQRGLENFRPKS